MISCRSYHHIKHGQWFLQGIIYGRLFIYISNLLLHVPVVYHVVFLFPLGEKWIWRPMSAKWRTFVPGSCLSMVGTPLEPRDKIPWQLVSYCWNSRRISTPALEDHLCHLHFGELQKGLCCPHETRSLHLLSHHYSLYAGKTNLGQFHENRQRNF